MTCLVCKNYSSIQWYHERVKKKEFLHFSYSLLMIFLVALQREPNHSSPLCDNSRSLLIVLVETNLEGLLCLSSKLRMLYARGSLTAMNG